MLKPGVIVCIRLAPGIMLLFACHPESILVELFFGII